MSVNDVTWTLVTVAITTSVAGCICAICAVERIIAFFERDDTNLTSVNEVLITEVA